MSTMTINGQSRPLPDDADALLVDVIRDQLALTGTKLVCGSGVCGACTVLLDGSPVASCLLPAQAAAGKTLTTVEGIGGTKLHPIQKAFMAHDALQCGFCTPGFIVEAAAFHGHWRAAKRAATPSREEIAAALSGHLCRCGAYENIFRAVADACAGRFDGDNVIAPRIEARDKVTGAARYTVDIRHDGQLEGVILRSPAAHAKITALDLAPARALPGVAAAIPLLADDNVVRYVGAPIAAVAAKDRRTALAAIAAIRFSSETLPAAIGLDAARRADAPVVFARADRKYAGNVSEGGGSPASWKGNVRGPSAAFSQKGKRAKAWLTEAHERRDPLLVEATFRVATQSHACLEPHAAVARFDGDRLTVHASTQAVYEAMEKLSKRYKLPHDKVRVIADHVGGGFGSKGSLGMETIAADRARARGKGAGQGRLRPRGRAVRHRLSAGRGNQGRAPAVRERRSQSAVADRPCRHRGGDELDHCRTGAADLSGGSEGARRFRRHQQPAARRAIPRPRRSADGFCAGTGGRRSCPAAQGRPDQLCASAGTPIPTGNGFTIGRAASTSGVTARRPAAQNGRYRRGVGIAAGYWLYLWQPGSSIELAIEGGRFVAKTAVQDIGTGTRSVIAGTLAKAFGLEPQDIEVRIGDSSLPEGPGSGGSRVTASIVPPMLAAIEKLKAAILRSAARPPAAGSNAPWRELIAASPDLSVSAKRPNDHRPAPGITSPLKQAGLMGLIFGWMMRTFNNIVVGAGVPSSVQVMEVEVDTWLGHVRVLNAYAGLAIGKDCRACARAQPGGGLGHSGHWLRALRSARNRCPDRPCAVEQHGGLPHSRDRRHAALRGAFR